MPRVCSGSAGEWESVAVVETLGRGVDGRESAEGHLAGSEAAGLGHVADPRYVDRGSASATGLRVARGEGCRESLGVPRQPVETLRVANHDMGARLTGDVEPEVTLGGELEGQDVVVRRRSTHQHDQAVRGNRGSRNRPALPDARLRI